MAAKLIDSVISWRLSQFDLFTNFYVFFYLVQQVMIFGGVMHLAA